MIKTDALTLDRFQFKRILRLCLFCILPYYGLCQSNFSNQESSYTTYYHQINKGNYLLGESADSFIFYYDKAFNLKEPIKVDIINYLIVKFQNKTIVNSGLDSLILRYLLTSEQEKKDFRTLFRKIRAPKSLRKRIKNLSVGKVDSMYLSDLAFYDSIIKKDQQMRNPFIWSFISYEKKQKNDSFRYAQVQSRIRLNGYPGVMRSPIDNLTLVYMHNIGLLDIVELEKRVLHGELHPNSYGYIFDRWTFITGIEDNLCVGLVLNDSKDIDLINVSRANIGLPPLEHEPTIKKNKKKYGLINQF